MSHASAIARGKLLRISSQDRRPGQPHGNFDVILNNASFIQTVRGIVPKSVSFKHVFPNIFSGNNTLEYSYDGNLSSFTIAEGWYEASDLITALNAGFAADPIVTGSVVVSLVDAPTSTTQKYLFTSDLDLIILSEASGNPMATIVGAASETAGTAVVMDYIPDLAGLNVVYLCSADLASNNASASSNNGEQVPIVCEIPITVGYGEHIHYRANDDSLESIIYSSDRQLTRVSMALCNRSGVALDLEQNGLVALFKVIGSEYFAVN